MRNNVQVIAVSQLRRAVKLHNNEHQVWKAERSAQGYMHHSNSSIINQWIVMSGKGHRGNTVDTKEFPFAKHRIGNVHLMFMTKDKAIQQSKTTTFPGFYLISRNSSRRFPVNFELIKLSRTKIISFQNFTDCSSCQTAKHALLTPVTFPSFSKNL